MKATIEIYTYYQENFKKQICQEPTGIILDTRMINGKTAFFPAGDGLYYEDGEPSQIDYMIIGQDFDTFEKFKNLLNKNASELETKNTTWTNLINLLNGAGIDKSSVFYTNAIMGYRTGDKNTGKSPAFKSEDFIEKCKEFMLLQIQHIQPKKIIVLGANLFDFMADISNGLEPIKGTKKFKNLEKRVYKNITFKEVPSFKCDVLFMLHPSLFYANARENRELYLDELRSLQKTK